MTWLTVLLVRAGGNKMYGITKVPQCQLKVAEVVCAHTNFTRNRANPILQATVIARVLNSGFFESS